jgi:hypothetical protein
MALVELGSYPNAMEAAMVRGRLQAEGVDSVAFDGGMNIADSSGWLVPVRVMVLDEDLKAAREIVAQ